MYMYTTHKQKISSLHCCNINLIVLVHVKCTLINHLQFISLGHDELHVHVTDRKCEKYDLQFSYMYTSICTCMCKNYAVHMATINSHDARCIYATQRCKLTCNRRGCFKIVILIIPILALSYNSKYRLASFFFNHFTSAYLLHVIGGLKGNTEIIHEQHAGRYMYIVHCTCVHVLCTLYMCVCAYAGCKYLNLKP